MPWKIRIHQGKNVALFISHSYLYICTIMKVKIINTSNNPLPAYATEGSAGLDVYANIVEQAITLLPFERRLIPTGLYIELPTGYEAQMRPRSGLALKKGLTLPNTPATIDSDYRGELKVILINLSKENQTIKHGDRIAQMVIKSYEKIILEETDKLSSTLRNEGGFGHSGD